MGEVQLLFMKDELHQMHIHKEYIPLSSRENRNPRACMACEKGSAFHLSLSLVVYSLHA